MIVKTISDLPTTERTDIGSFFVSAKSAKKIIIPNSYQREYSWGKDQIVELIDDIIEMTESERDVCYLGRIVLSPLSGTNEYYLVDGQQRLTTLFMILHVISNKTRNPYNIDQLFYGNNSAKNNGLILKYSSVSHNSELENLGKSTTVNSLHEGYKIISDILIDQLDLDYEVFLQNFKNRIFIEVQTVDEDYQQDYFMDINNKGKQLDSIDVLKNTLRNNSGNVKLFDEVWLKLIATVTSIPNVFNRSRGKSKLDIILSWYLRVSGKKNDSFLWEIKNDNVFRFLFDILDLSKFALSFLNNDGKNHEVSKVLRDISPYSWIPFAWKHKDLPLQELMRRIVLKSLISQNGEKFRQSLNNLRDPITVSEFKNMTRLISYNNKTLSQKFLVLAESLLCSKLIGVSFEDVYMEISPMFKGSSAKSLTLEHIRPQSYDNPSNSIGNLTILTKSDNSAIKDGNKFNTYLKSGLILTQLLCDGKKHELEKTLGVESWESFSQDTINLITDEQIQKRIDNISEYVYNNLN